MKVVLVTNIPAPYREKVYELVATQIDFSVVYCANVEPNRKWKFELGNYPKFFVSSSNINWKGRIIYLWSNIWQILTREQPNVVVICGFSIPMLTTYLWAMLHKAQIVSFTDAIIDSEKSLSVFHKFVRRLGYGFSKANIGASIKSKDLLRIYSQSHAKLFQSALTIDKSHFSGIIQKPQFRQYDLLLCGQFIPRKMFDFSLDVIFAVREIIPNIKVKILGDGPLKEHILNRIHQNQLDIAFEGFVQQQFLFDHYSDCRIFLFPSQSECWGVVANEACAAGTIVFTTPNVGCADELIIHGKSGLVLEPDVQTWKEHVITILRNQNLLEQMSKDCLSISSNFNQQDSAQGIVDAVTYAWEHR